jgi:DNA processing protein
MMIHKTDREFPARLLQIRGFDQTLNQPLESPERIFTAGAETAVLNSARTISIVGTRSPFYKAFEIAQWVGRLAASDGILVVSGFATGIDAAGHYGAMDAEGKTVAVLGSGVNVRQPVKSALERFVLRNGLFISEHEDPNTPREYTHLMARDRITAGLADVIFVIDTDPNGGAVHTARVAQCFGKRVYALDWSASPKYRDMSQGGNQLLINEGVAYPVSVDGLDSDVERRIRSCFPITDPAGMNLQS